jgi:L-aminopeptidase/D-esterase-like protein
MGAPVRVGHWTDPVARTGCTVVLLGAGTTASGEIRGNAPASRETALLAPGRTVSQAHAFVLAGGSAFGLATADGVMAWLAERDIGFATRAGAVPIVPTMCLFDLAVGDAAVRPGLVEGRAACEDAAVAESLWSEPLDRHIGRVGAGAGCTVGKWHDPAEALDSGLGAATVTRQDLRITALVALNAAGFVGERRDLGPPYWDTGAATTVGVVLTNARLDKVGCFGVAQSGHDGLARAIDPVHTGMDGDGLLVAATGDVDAPLDLVRALGARAVEDAVRSVPLG